VNAIDPRIGAKIYESVLWKGKRYTGEEAARILIRNQLKGVKDAVKAGARYIVAPNTNETVIAECKRSGVPVFPGALTPTEIATAMCAGADAIKVFPCNAMGGPDYIRSLLAPFPEAVLVPCGGVNAKNAAAYFAAGAQALFTGTQLVDRETVNSGRYNDITQKALNLSAIAAASRKKAA
jgi:2-dehydro-3-deoxyphosphogluconate aldolase/(4S)-4-hydroxy-2-oxoglutarate aldolase